ncbi:MAG: C40 family peptidase [Burkholderiales bacterium]|nr:C40 family peptidase [Burkholderiales bacterium]
MRFRKIAWLLCVICSFLTSFAAADENDDDTAQTKEVAVGQDSQDMIGSMLLQSVSLIGIPYKWGGNTPQQGMDCSGFIRYVFKKSLGINLPRTAGEMAKVGKRVSIDELEPGDLIFFNTKRGYNTHMGMYIGNNKFIQAPHTGADIQVTELNSSWRSKINGAKRIVQEDEDGNGKTVVQSYQEINDEALPVRYGYTKRSVRKKSNKSNSMNTRSKRSTNKPKHTTLRSKNNATSYTKKKH